MAKKYAVEIKARKIGNGFLLTGHVQSENGGHKELEETFYPSLPALDAGISDVLSTAEQVAEAIKAQSPSGFYTIGLGTLWGNSDESDGDEDGNG